MKPTYIVNESKRNQGNFGTKKMLHEISTLYGIHACAIIYGQNETEPEVWPSYSEVQRVINRLNAMSEIDQRINMSTLESFLKKNFEKA
ncbi:hypothetical protein Lal_00012467 [Lupinus albus]|nr:hypothetical protein Lal_00012467 [Lupinus albus]